MQIYRTVTAYVSAARVQLQDMVSPYRYSDAEVVGALDRALQEIGRIRPDVFLDLKYQYPLKKGDLNDGMPPVYTTDDIAFLGDGISYDINNGTTVPVPGKYYTPVSWYIAGWLQLYDMADTQDARGQAFIQKFQTDLMTLSAT